MQKYIRIFLWIVFLSAWLYRAFNIQVWFQEMSLLHMPILLSYFVIVFEIILWALLLLNKYVENCLKLIILFLLCAIVQSFIVNFYSIIANLWELFVFDANPTDILLHMTYILLMFILLKSYLKK